MGAEVTDAAEPDGYLGVGGRGDARIVAAMKKGFSLAWSSWGEVDERLPLIARAGFDGIEPTFNDGAIPSPAMFRQEARELRQRCDDLGLAIPSMRGGRRPWSTIPSAAAAERKEALIHVERALECLALMGGSVLLVVPGQARSDILWEDHWQRVVEFARQAGDMARGMGMSIGFENVEARFPLSPRDWRDLIDHIDHPNVGMYLDVGNVVWLGLGFPEQWIGMLGPRILRVHAKDAAVHLKGAALFGEIRHVLAGDVDWAAVMAGLRGIGYDEWLTVEPDWYRHAPQRLPERLAADIEAIFAL